MAEKKATTRDVVSSQDAGATPTGDHTTADLEGSYRENPEKPADESVAQVQDVPKGWPGASAERGD